ncbi:MAG: Ger(x)C family spore germination protein [Alicyclobacillus herbarius]|uniref:Ger(x)C family spore germination protein n=1 Tax=Alicyclobacillus herbarius TaxID=122960 RepID=UPI002352573C|nr:Ger(x)C family spore germination protein [Alicyclobacillus herbarius]MCL6631708.1 Ger(x)C family spore germination protein [Alicyclobacillus herbarius]
MHRLRKWGVWLMAVSCLSLLTGCFDRQELEQLAFVTGVGLDKAPHGLIDVTLQIAAPEGNDEGGGGGSGKEQGKGTQPVTFRVHSIPEALSLANTSIERTVTLSHLSIVIFGESLAKEGLKKTLEPMVRFREFRRTLFVAVAKGEAKDIFANDNLMLERSTARLADNLFVMGNRNGLFPSKQLQDFLVAVENPHEDPLLPVFAVNQAVAQTSGGEAASGQNDSGGGQGDSAGGSITKTTVDFTAGQVARAGGNPVEWIGGALFRGDKLVGYLSGREMLYLRILDGSLHSAKVDFADPLHPQQTIGLFLRKERSPSEQLVLTNPPRVRFLVPLDADLTTAVEPSAERSLASQEIEQSLDKTMANEMAALLKKLYHQYEVDPIPLSRRLRTHFLTHQAVVQYPWRERMRKADFQVRVDLNIRRFGIQAMPRQTK